MAQMVSQVHSKEAGPRWHMVAKSAETGQGQRSLRHSCKHKPKHSIRHGHRCSRSVAQEGTNNKGPTVNCLLIRRKLLRALIQGYVAVLYQGRLWARSAKSLRGLLWRHKAWIQRKIVINSSGQLRIGCTQGSKSTV